MDYTQMLGNSNELKCITAFIQLGFECSIPYGNGAKYDFIADDGEHLYRIQCKSSNYVNDHGVIREDAFMFNTTCQTTNTKETIKHTYSSKEIDYFATSFKENVYVVPVEECKTSKTLRLKPPTNGQINYSKAEDYLITNIFSYSQKLKDSYVKYKERNIINNKQIQQNKDSEKETSITEHLKYTSKKQQKVERPEQEELLQLIQTKSFCEIGRIYGVTDNAIRKWCRDYNLPSTKYELIEYNKDPENFSPFKKEKTIYDSKIIIKIYNEGYNQKEIAQYLGCSEDTVRKHLKQNNISCRYGIVKKFGQYSLDGQFIQYFYGAQEVRDWYLKEFGKELKDICHIGDCCNGKMKSAYGYIWKYENKLPIDQIN